MQHEITLHLSKWTCMNIINTVYINCAHPFLFTHFFFWKLLCYLLFIFCCNGFYSVSIIYIVTPRSPFWVFLFIHSQVYCTQVKCYPNSGFEDIRLLKISCTFIWTTVFWLVCCDFNSFYKIEIFRMSWV